ncbi:ABC transporter ATP-binding protein [Corynebacterium heidelbergense]|uniref:ABC transporter ATP-binding protein n=1 Tax=Corynebacterium heidelbergense TaxID=2055947 RepID=A0A364V4U0_9CORY|nr:ABC transporter ATP-binding protein [Corynebacterium heidelbergense]RAV31670.1 ABC transporter ATP-binding protein [Corynebacterium heidelbergense]
MKNAVVRVKNFSRAYGKSGINWATGLKRNSTLRDHIAVDRISFTIHRGECYGLLGTNGAGKTSTLEVLEGLARRTDGTVRMLDKDPIGDRKVLRPHMGVMLQHGGLPQELTVAETMRMWAETCSSPQPVEQVLDQVKLNHRVTHKVGSLSGGEQRRLDLACALVGNPSILFLDEPTTGLDPESRQNTWNLLLELKQRGVTMVLTTHYLEEAEHLCDRIAIMHQGRIEVEGTLSELVSTVPAEIRFDLNAPVTPLPELPGTSVLQDGTRFVIRTPELQRHCLQVLSWADSQGIQLLNFAAQPASLDNVFLNIAGKTASHAHM